MVYDSYSVFETVYLFVQPKKLCVKELNVRKTERLSLSFQTEIYLQERNERKKAKKERKEGGYHAQGRQFLENSLSFDNRE